LFADGLFEYQHANGADEQASLLSGFQAWARVDLATLQTAIGAQDAQGLPMMGLTYPAGDDGEEHSAPWCWGRWRTTVHRTWMPPPAAKTIMAPAPAACSPAAWRPSTSC
jgi:hypothetical protein